MRSSPICLPAGVQKRQLRWQSGANSVAAHHSHHRLRARSRQDDSLRWPVYSAEKAPGHTSRDTGHGDIRCSVRLPDCRRRNLPSREGRAAATNPVRDAKEDASKGLFKLSLIEETVNADPLLKPADKVLLSAYTEIYVVADAPGIVEHHLRDSDDRPVEDRQIPVSRARLVKRAYLAEAGSREQIKIYTVCNPHLETMRDHVAMTAEHLREIEAETRREGGGSCPRKICRDKLTMSLNQMRDVPAKFAENSLKNTPQDIAMKERNPSCSVSGTADDDYVFPVPTDEAEADRMIAEILCGIPVSSSVESYMRKKLMLSDQSVIVEQQRELLA